MRKSNAAIRNGLLLFACIVVFLRQLDPEAGIEGIEPVAPIILK